MMHRQQRQSLTFRTSLSSGGSSSSSLSTDYSSAWSIVARRCPSNGSSPSSRCSSSSVLLSVLAWSVTLLPILCLGIADARVLKGHLLLKRSYEELPCKGFYDRSLFARLDNVCDDCYNLFRNDQVYEGCRMDCFTATMFKACVDVLILQDNLPLYKEWIRQLNGAEVDLC